jgi:plastocyanin
MHSPRLLPLLAGAGLVALAGVGCGESDDDSTSSAAVPPAAPAASAPSGGGAAQAELSADPGGALAFVPNALTVAGGQVTLVMHNPASSGKPHAIAVEGDGVDQDGQTAAPGSDSSVTAMLKPGTYKLYCPVGNHEQGGMVGTLTVT